MVSSSSLHWIRLGSKFLFCYGLLVHISGTAAANTFKKKNCPDLNCNLPQKSQNCVELTDQKKINEASFKFTPEDECCPVYNCSKAGKEYIGVFKGLKKKQPIVQSITTTTIKPTLKICEGIICKPKPTEGNCNKRDAASMGSARSAKSVSGAQSCCPWWACSHPNGTLTMHYSGPNNVKPPGRSLGTGIKTPVDPEVAFNQTCSGMFCLEGSPSKNCRQHTPPNIKQLMKVEQDCCPMWTCSHSTNGSMYYIHPGMQQKSKFWNMTIGIGDDLVGDPVTEPPLSDVNGTNSSTVAPEEKNDLDLDPMRGIMALSSTKTPSPQCPRVQCLPPQEGLKCSVLANPDSGKLKLLGLESDCCPVYKCSGTKKSFVVQFGMYVAEVPNNKTANDTHEYEAYSMRPTSQTTTVPSVRTTMKPTTTTTVSVELNLKTTTTASAQATMKPTAQMSVQSTLKPTAELSVKTTLKPTTEASVQSKSIATTGLPSLERTTLKPKTTTVVTTTMAKARAVPKADPKKDPIKTTTMASNIVKAKATPKVLIRTTTKASISTTKIAASQTDVQTTTLASTIMTSTIAATETNIQTTTMVNSRTSTKATPAIYIHSTKIPNRGRNANPSFGTGIQTTTSPNISADDETLDEDGDDPTSMITNSTVDKPQCKNVQCFPTPSKQKCTDVTLTDCDMLALLGSTVDCCPSYKCNYPNGNVIQFGMTDGISEYVILSPVSNDEKNKPNCTKPDVGHTVPSNKSIKGEEYRFEIDTVTTEAQPVTLRPVMILEMINQANPNSRNVRYVKNCTSVSCSPPPGLDMKNCQKLSKATVPKIMKSRGVTSACCSIWKCVSPDKKVSTHYGYSETPETHIPFEYRGNDTDKLPKSLAKETETAHSTSTCPHVICLPPLENADCKVANKSRIKSVKGSLRRKNKCCPTWNCKRKDETTITIYGRTSPKDYSKFSFHSVLQGKPPSPTNTTNLNETQSKGRSPTKSFSLSEPNYKPNKSKKIGKKSKKKGKKLDATKRPETLNPQRKKTPSKLTSSSEESVSSESKEQEPAPLQQQQNRPPEIPMDMQRNQMDFQQKPMEFQQDELLVMQRNNMENLQRMQANNNAAMNMNQPPTLPPYGVQTEYGSQYSSSNQMVQKMDMDGMHSEQYIGWSQI